eukprot:scaffold815_cov273-Chaetoceros_neogracile.AAC.26
MDHMRRIKKHQRKKTGISKPLLLLYAAGLSIVYVWGCILASSHTFTITDQIPTTFTDDIAPKPFPTVMEILKKHEALALKKAEERLLAETLIFGTAKLDTASYTPKGGNRFREWKAGDSPYSSFMNQEMKRKSDDLARKRRGYIKAAMQHAWKGYKTHAFGADEVGPISGKPNSHWGGIGTTLVDALDSLWLMDMKDEFYEARDWVRDKLDHNKNMDASLFETTIRSLGGLLSAYEWSGDRIFLEKAQDLGNRLVKAFDAPGMNGIPKGYINLSTGKSSTQSWLRGSLILSDIATLPVEFRQLSKHTGNKTYAIKAEHIFLKLKDIEPTNGLFPYYLRVRKGNLEFANKAISFGAFGDSFYEYLLKMWLQGGRTEPMYRSMYDKAIDGMHAEQLRVSVTGLTYIYYQTETSQMDHLSCFMGGLLVLGAWSDPNGISTERAQRDLKTGKALAYTCYQMYASMPTGLSPDIVRFDDSGIRAKQKSYLLRPETVETMFILNSITGDPIYREWGWEIFQSIEKYCKTEIAYGSLDDVMDTDKAPKDSMESFFLAETMKYLFLLMDPDSEVNLENYVFNTEAHPLKVWK